MTKKKSFPLAPKQINENQAVPKPPSKKEQVREAVRQRAMVKEKIYPVLLKYAKNIRNAKNICKTLVVGLDTVFMMDMKKYSEFRSKDRLSTLNLKGFMNEGKDYEAEWELVNLLQDESITTAKALIDGMERELQRLTDKEELTKPLTELKTEFL